jgi:uncharacterized protein (TIRG00374 family)
MTMSAQPSANRPEEARASSGPEEAPAAQAPAPPQKKWLRRGLGAAGYLAIIALAWRTIDRDRLIAGLSHLRATHVLLVLAISLLHIAGRAFRYHRLLLRNHPTEYRWIDGFAIFLIGLSTSAVTPARAGDFVKAQLVRRHGIAFSAGFGLVLIERVIDLLVLTLSILGAGLLVSGESSAPWSRAAIVLLGFLILGVGALTSRKLRNYGSTLVTRMLSRVWKKKGTSDVSAKLEAIFSTWDVVFTSPATLVVYLGGSMLVWAVEFAKLWCVLTLLGVNVSPEAVFFVYPVSILAGVLTILPFSEGVVGVTGVALLSSIAHVDPALAAVAVVIDRVASGAPPILLAAASPLWARNASTASGN